MPRPPSDDFPDERRRAFGERLRELRAAAGLTQEAVAEAAGMERSFYAKLESGQHSVLLDRLWDLAAAMRTEPHELLRPVGMPPVN